MPCRDYDEDCETFGSRQTERVTQLTQMLCLACRYLEFDRLDDQPLNVLTEDDLTVHQHLVKWWRQHKALDALDRQRALGSLNKGG